jgi:DinB superfamily
MSELADLLERFRRGAEIVAVGTTGAAGSMLDYRPVGADGKPRWSVRMIVCHLADTEVVTAMRFRQVIAEDNPTLHAFDQDSWAERLSYEKRKISDALDTLRRLRADNYELLKALPEEAFARGATHSVKGKLTLLDMLKTFAGHVESHVQQIHGVRAAYKEYKASLNAAAAPAEAPSPVASETVATLPK